jgi:hypothetical protein
MTFRRCVFAIAAFAYLLPACSEEGAVGDTSDTGQIDAPIANYAFVSPVPVSGALGGLDGADALCNGWAVAAGIGGSYRAILSVVGADAKERLDDARGWIRPDGRPVADEWTEPFGPGGLLAPLRIDPGGNDLGNVRVWSASGNDGVYNTFGGGTDCGGWDSADPGVEAWYGFADTTAEWLDRGGRESCDSALHLYCFQVDLSIPLDVSDFAVAGRRMFVSTGNFDVSTGIAGADALCAADVASTPALGGASVKAFLADIGTSAGERFAVDARPIVRLDGLIVADDIAQLTTDGSLVHPPSLRVDGSYQTFRTFAGATSPSAVGSAATTCNGWTEASTGDVRVGFPHATLVVSQRTWFGTSDECSRRSGSLPVYCLED